MSVARLQLGVAFDASGERLLDVKPKLRENLAQLIGDVVVADEDGAHRTRLDDAAASEVAVARQQHAILGGGLTHQRGVLDVSVVRSVVTKGPQPSREPPDVAIGDESGFHLLEQS